MDAHKSFFKDQGIEVVAIANQSNTTLQKFKERTGYFPQFIGDPKRRLIKDFKVFTKGNLGEKIILKGNLAIKSLFLIDSEGRVAWRYISRDKKDNPPIDSLKDAVKQNL